MQVVASSAPNLVSSDKSWGDLGGTSGSPTFDANGNATVTLNVNDPSNNFKPHNAAPAYLQVIDFNYNAPGGQIVTNIAAPIHVNTAYGYVAFNSHPYDKSTVSLAGVKFAGKKVYGEITNLKGNKVIRKFFIGKANASGYVTKKAVVAPTQKVTGTYRFYFLVNNKRLLGQYFAYKFEVYTF